MWSSCACVSTRASMSSRRCLDVAEVRQDQVHAGLVVGGEQHPQSMISNLPRCSRTAMLRPISPIPPSAVTRRAPGPVDPGVRASLFTGYARSRRARMSAANLVEFGGGGICGNRGRPASKPCSRSPAFDSVPTEAALRRVQRPSATAILRRSRRRRNAKARQHVLAAGRLRHDPRR